MSLNHELDFHYSKENTLISILFLLLLILGLVLILRSISCYFNDLEISFFVT